MRKPIAVLAFAALGFGALQTQAAELDIRWENPERYRDVEASNSVSQSKYEQRVFDELSSHFSLAAARQLPPGQQLNVVVHDVDLAGYVEYFIMPYNQGIRVVDDLYAPRLDFSWELRDEADQVIAQGEAELKERTSFRHFNTRINRNDPLFYEKRLIDEWMRTNFFDPAQS